VLELFPVLGRAAEDAARQAGLSPSTKPTLLIRGGDRLGLMTLFYRAVEDEGINIDFLVAQALGDEFSVVIGLATDAEADQAAAAIERLAKEG